MKKAVILFLLLLCKLTLQAQESERNLTVSDIQKSGCISNSRGAEAQDVLLPVIILEKEGNVLNVELQSFWNNCGTMGYNISAELFDGWKGAPYPDSVSVKIVPYIPRENDCSCPYNVSFKLQGLESNTFYLTCWCFDLKVDLTEGEPLVLANVSEQVNVDGTYYQLYKNFNQAIVNIGSSEWKGEVSIPSEITYQNQTYTVIGTSYYAFNSLKELTKINVPSTIKDFYCVLYNINNDMPCNPFYSCLALEAIEVEEGNAAVQSFEGVMYDKKMTTLWAYPSASSREAYKVPDDVKTLAHSAFRNSSNLTSIELPSGLKSIGYAAFEKCTSLKTLDIPENVTRIDTHAFNGTQLTDLYIRGVIDSAYMYVDKWLGRSMFAGISPDTKIYVLPSEVERYQSIFGGTFYPLPPADQTQDIRLIEESRLSPAETFDLQGRRLNAEPKHGVYIRNGKKVVR